MNELIDMHMHVRQLKIYKKKRKRKRKRNDWLFLAFHLMACIEVRKRTGIVFRSGRKSDHLLLVTAITIQFFFIHLFYSIFLYKKLRKRRGRGNNKLLHLNHFCLFINSFATTRNVL